MHLICAIELTAENLRIGKHFDTNTVRKRCQRSNECAVFGLIIGEPGNTFHSFLLGGRADPGKPGTSAIGLRSGTIHEHSQPVGLLLNEYGTGGFISSLHKSALQRFRALYEL